MHNKRTLLFLVLLFGFSLWSKAAHIAPKESSLLCLVTADAGPDDFVCNVGDQVVLNGFVSDPFAEFMWTPSTGLSNPFSLNPTATITNTITYTLEARAVDPLNLVFNGDFNAGAAGFSSDYIPGTGGPWGLLSNEGQYAVSNDPSNTHTNFSPCSDHTGDPVGNMMVINGAPIPNQNVWCQTVAVTPNTEYEFGAWLASVNPSSPAVLQFSINGLLIGSQFGASSTTCAWQQFFAIWNSGGSSTAEICIVNQNTATSGNDFALDDITFNEVCTAFDEVTIFLNQTPPTFITQTVCPNNNCVVIEGIPYCGEGNFVIDLLSSQGCDSTIILDIIENNPLLIIPDPGMITCMNPTINLQPILDTPGLPTSITWSGPNGFNSGDLIILASDPGSYLLEIDVLLNGVTCTVSDFIIVEENIVLPHADAGGNVEVNCGESFPITLDGTASDSGPDIEYQWSGPGVSGTMPTQEVTQAGTYILLVSNVVTGCIESSVAIVTEGNTLPEISPTADTLSCAALSITLMGESNTPNVTYSWIGPNGFVDSIANPTVMNAGTYYLTVSGGPNCLSMDSVYVSIDTLTSIPLLNNGMLTCVVDSTIINVLNPDTSLTYNWNGPGGYTGTGPSATVNIAGIYELITTADNGCTATGTSTVTADSDLPNVTASGGDLNCLIDSIMLLGSSSTPGVTFSWVGPNGFSSNDQNPTVSDAGSYTLTVLAGNGCESMAPLQVMEDVNLPDVNATGGELNCLVDSIIINGSSSTIGASFSWTGPNGFSSDNANPTVNDPGEYILTVLGTNGCEAEVPVQVTIDNIVPDLQVSNVILACDETSTTLVAMSTNGLQFEWTYLPNGTNYTGSSISVSDLGVYEVTVQSANGCTTTDQVDLSLANDVIDLSISGTNITCQNNLSTLTPSSNFSIDQYSWTGPNGYSSALENPDVGQAGIYELTVTTAAGCTATESITIDSDAGLPEIAAQGGTIFCDPNMVMLAGYSTTIGVTYLWEGPNGFSTSDQNPIVSEAGEYTFSVIGNNGCTAQQIVQVQLDNAIPDLNPTGANLPCGATLTQLFSNSLNAISYSWTGPNGFNSIDADPMVTAAGTYTVEVTSANGCTNSEQVIVMAVGGVPDLVVVGGTIDCANSSINLSANSSATIADYNWTGPNGFMSSESNPMVVAGGDYFVTITTDAGCENTGMVNVDQNGDLPLFTLQTDYLINCTAPSIALLLSLDNAADQVSWTGPNGFSSTDLNPIVMEEGSYQVTILSDNGCSAIGTANVLGDFAVPDFDVTATTISCTNLTSDLTILTADSDLTTDWFGVGTVQNNGLTATTNTIGDYQVQVTGANGCFGTESFEVFGTTDIPAIQGTNLLINCNQPTAFLAINSTIPLENFDWIGPSGYTANIENPMINMAGTYFLTATTADDCIGTTEIIVTEDFVSPIVTADGTLIDCSNPMSTISASFDDPLATITWEGPNGYTATGATQMVNSAGEYTATATSLNGCVGSATADVLQDNAVPFLLIDVPSLDCNNSLDSIHATTNVGGGNYTWMVNDTLAGIGPDLGVTHGGDYTITYDLGNGCNAVETVVVQEDFEEPVVSLNQGTLDCDNASLTLFPTTTEDIVSWVWSGPNGFASNSDTVQVSEPGFYTLSSYLANGCFAGDIVNINPDFSSPNFLSTSATITCNDPVADLEVIGSTTGFDFQWNGPNNFQSNLPNNTVSDAGNYNLIITGPNGCTQHLLSMVDVDTLLPSFSLDPGTLTCIVNQIELQSSDPIIGTYSWTGPNGFSSTQENIFVNEAGIYELSITPDNGCANVQTTEIFSDMESPIVMTSDAHLSCTDNSVSLSATFLEQGGYIWNGPNGFTSTDQTPTITEPGVYQFIFLADDNGCEGTATATVTQDVPVDVKAEKGSPLCFDERGSITFDEVTGGTPPYLYSIDGGQSFLTQSTFNNLSPGVYNLEVQDAGECDWKDELTIDPAQNIFVQINPTIDIDYGDSVQLQPDINFSAADILSITWTPSIGLSCTDCLNPYAAPGNDITYRLEIETDAGCGAEASVQLRVKNDKYIYIPNVFSPNDDGSNDQFTVFADAERIKEIERLIVVDRWGAIVFARDNLIPNDLSLGWDGTMNGVPMNPGVFVYYVKVEWLDGSKVDYKGDVTLVR